MGVGTLGGIAGRKAITKAVETIYQKGQDDAGNTP
jgi:hypothetical protein